MYACCCLVGTLGHSSCHVEYVTYLCLHARRLLTHLWLRACLRMHLCLYMHGHSHTSRMILMLTCTAAPSRSTILGSVTLACVKRFMTPLLIVNAHSAHAIPTTRTEKLRVMVMALGSSAPEMLEFVMAKVGQRLP